MKQWKSTLPGFSAEAALVRSGNLYGAARQYQQGRPVIPTSADAAAWLMQKAGQGIKDCLQRCGGNRLCEARCVGLF